MITKTIESYVSRINQCLTDTLHNQPINAIRLKDALCYSALNGGKRIRSILIYLSGECFNAPIEALDYAACAIELVHAYSLVHDDLPAMDNDSLRRGKPTCHIQFDEATAILTGDLMQSLAFSLLTDKILVDKIQIKHEQIIYAFDILSHALNEMVSGQVLDLESENKEITYKELETIHSLKTGRLITAALLLGLTFSPEYQNKIYQSQLKKLGSALGLGFQIQDDILDVTATTEMLGKQQGSDLSHGKSTYPSLLGLAESKSKLKELYLSAHEAASKLPNSQSLLDFINWIDNRDH